MTKEKLIIAVIFGGRSVEHDVSILTGLQFLDALDQSRYQGLPLYVDPDGQWWTGDLLLKRSLYPHSADTRARLTPVTLPLGTSIRGRPHLMASQKGFLGNKAITIPFDLIVPAIHGSNGEDGSLQGLLSFTGIPYAGCRPLGAAATMDKHVTKEALKTRNIPLLPHILVEKPAAGTFLSRDTILPQMEAKLGADMFPVIVKPRRLGSSVGVTIARDADGLDAALSSIFRMDTGALIEPLVPNLVEYNIAVMRKDGQVITSAIEKPLNGSDMLDFNTKYRAGSNGAPKLDEAPSDGMASLNRELNPAELSEGQDGLIRSAASTAFDLLDLAGTVRIDFLCNAKTGELWLNEVNSIPGSFAYFLWQAAQDPLSFTDLSRTIVEEGMVLSRAEKGETGTAIGNARIFGRD
ncbi:D-alanine--D-alanine ligase [Iodidimonas gelatinilytica]|uniref:D-alanine--D-alanine ligase n=1 Tax=Iodidimonas gelatinilytica TaxID=1236966 RepID=A0A5A7N1P1_9PROT|nr:D-alanine--D-alanine ligase [Iodidimonas gelatinilytica]GER02191.1 D-alanine--D-alanine ligase [Iodidimonas gelatinilytica]